jgi:hypothetical protein
MIAAVNIKIYKFSGLCVVQPLTSQREEDATVHNSQGMK